MMHHTIVDASTGAVTTVEFTQEEVLAYQKTRLEVAWTSIREQRNKYLASSDWTQVEDAPVNKSAWATYRQSLRDLPQNTTDPFNPVWPTEPT